jgi:hypothetical protein
MQEARTVSERRWLWLFQNTGKPCGYHSCFGILECKSIPILSSAKVVIGDLDVVGAEAVVAHITKDGGCVKLRREYS